jgi:gas vesicle protein
MNLSFKEEPAMYEPHYEEETGGGGFLIGLLCGTALGAAIGLMFAPKAGSEIRQRLYESTGDIRKKAYETYDQASEQVNNIVTKGRQAVDRGREAFETARQSASGQATSGNGSTSDFGTQTRSGVSDFNTGTRTTSGV